MVYVVIRGDNRRPIAAFTTAEAAAKYVGEQSVTGLRDTPSWTRSYYVEEVATPKETL